MENETNGDESTEEKLPYKLSANQTPVSEDEINNINKRKYISAIFVEKHLQCITEF